MSKYSTVIGIDAHKETNSVYAIDKTTGEVASAKLPSDAGALLGWIGKQGLSGPVGCCYESGPTGFWLAREMDAAGTDCHVAAVSRLAKRRDGRKTDALDAKTLAQLFEAGGTVDVWVPPVETEAHRNLSRLRSRAVKDATRAKQRVTSLLLTKGVRLEGDNWSGAWRKALKALRLPQPEDDYVLRELCAEAEHQEARVKAIDAELDRFRAAHGEYAETIRRLDSIYGVAAVTATAFAVEIGDFSRFSDGAGLASYVGLTPSESSTGQHRSTGAITKCGNSFLRTLSIEAASAYCRAKGTERAIDPSLAPEVRAAVAKVNKRLRKRYADLKRRKKSANKIKVAIAREMVSAMFYIATM